MVALLVFGMTKLGPVHASGEKLSRLARKNFDSPNNFVLFIWDGFPAKREIG